MKENWGAALAAVLHHEGGFVNHPLDPGGITNLGCTKATWEKWCGRPVTEAEMRALSPADVSPLYKEKYWGKVKGDELPAGVDYVVFDTAINSGPGRAAKLLQETIGTTPDGAIGPLTLRAVAAVPVADAINTFQDRRLAYLQTLPTWSTFGRGWARRVEEGRALALQMSQSA
jgi:lysozyme family protein